MLYSEARLLLFLFVILFSREVETNPLGQAAGEAILIAVGLPLGIQKCTAFGWHAFGLRALGAAVQE